MSGKRLLFLAIVGIFSTGGALVSAGATAVEYPHDQARPDYCLNCHTEEIFTHDCDEVAGFCLLADSVDGLCLLCHVKEECCRTGQEHQARLFLGVKNHPTDIDVDDVNPDYLPRTLPIHNDRITCRTCHLHTRPETGGYKQLRLVTIAGDRIDWTVLCADCHDKE